MSPSCYRCPTATTRCQPTMFCWFSRPYCQANLLWSSTNLSIRLTTILTRQSAVCWRKLCSAALPWWLLATITPLTRYSYVNLLCNRIVGCPCVEGLLRLKTRHKDLAPGPSPARLVARISVGQRRYRVAVDLAVLPSRPPACIASLAVDVAPVADIVGIGITGMVA